LIAFLEITLAATRLSTGAIESNSGRATAAPVPRNNVRREICQRLDMVETPEETGKN